MNKNGSIFVDGVEYHRTSENEVALVDASRAKGRYIIHVWEEKAICSSTIGLRITEKATGHSLFFPAFSSWNKGEYWSSSGSENVKYSYSLRFYTKKEDGHEDSVSWHVRYNGLYIRPVRYK